MSAALIIQNGRVRAVGHRPVYRRRLAVMAATLALAALVPTLWPSQAENRPTPSVVEAAVTPLAQALRETGWTQGWGTDFSAFEIQQKKAGFSPAQAMLASVLANRLDGVLLLGSRAQEDRSVQEGLRVRELLALQLRTAMVSPSQLMAFAEGLNAQVHEHEAALATEIDGFDAVGFLATVGWTEDDALHVAGLLEHTRQPVSDAMGWEDTRALWQHERLAMEVPGHGDASLGWPEAKARLQAAVDVTGLAQLRVSAAMLETPERADALAKRLVGLQDALSARFGVEGPFLGLGGRVKLDLSSPLDLDTHGQVVPGVRGVAMRTTLHALPHEHYHGVSATLSQEHRQAVAVMGDLFKALSEPMTGSDALLAATEARQQFEQFMDGLGLAETSRTELRQAQDLDGEWERLYGALTQQEGLCDTDARMALMMAMALSPHHAFVDGGAPRWVELREAVGQYLSQSGDLHSTVVGQYTASHEEILASAYAAQLDPTWTTAPGIRLGILDTPGPREAEIQAKAWQQFSVQAAQVWHQPVSTQQWRDLRQPAPVAHVHASKASPSSH